MKSFVTEEFGNVGNESEAVDEIKAVGNSLLLYYIAGELKRAHCAIGFRITSPEGRDDEEFCLRELRSESVKTALAIFSHFLGGLKSVPVVRAAGDDDRLGIEIYARVNVLRVKEPTANSVDEYVGIVSAGYRMSEGHKAVLAVITLGY